MSLTDQRLPRLLGSPPSGGRYYGSDGVRSPLDKYRGPGAPPFDPGYLRATCTVTPQGKPCAGAKPSGEVCPRCTGVVTLTRLNDNETQIEWDIEGLAPGAHGFHIHEKADFADGCISAVTWRRVSSACDGLCQLTRRLAPPAFGAGRQRLWMPASPLTSLAARPS